MLVRSFARQTLSVRYMPAIMLMGFAALSYARFGRSEVLGALAMLLLLSGFPYAAVELIAMDRDGRLDQLRLAGWSPARMLSMVVAASAGPWVLFGVVLLFVSMLAGGANRVQLAAVAVLPLGSLALSMAAIASRATRQIDSRIATAGVSVAGMFGAGLFIVADSANATPLGRWLTSSPAVVDMASAVLVIFELLAVVLAVPRVLRLVRRPIEAADRPDVGIALTRRLRRWCHPTMWRGVTLSVIPALALSVLAIGVISVLGLLWWFRTGDPSTTMALATPTILYLFLLFFGAGVISGHCREDAEVGRLDLLRLSSDRPLALIAKTVVSFWLPFLLSAAGLSLLAIVMWQQAPAHLPLAFLVIVLMGPLAAVEGWCRYLPFGLVAPAGLFVVWKVPGPTSIGDFVLCLAAIGWIPWVMARETLRDPDHPFMRGLAASLAVAGVAFAIFWPPPSRVDLAMPMLHALILSVVLVHGGSWLAFPRLLPAPLSDILAPPLAVLAVVVSILVLAGRSTVPDAVTLAAIPAAALWIGRRIHESLSGQTRWSVALRTVLALAGMFAIWTIRVESMDAMECGRLDEATGIRIRLDAADATGPGRSRFPRSTPPP